MPSGMAGSMMRSNCQAEAVYGLTEFYREEIRGARLVAGTGCNAATGQYALRPLIADGVIDLDDIIIDLKTGVSGAGRSLKENLLHAELSEGSSRLFRGRHAPASGRIRSGVFCHGRTACQGAVHAAFIAFKQRDTCHRLCKRRPGSEVHASLARAYANEPFVEMLPFGQHPSTRHIRGSNFCHIGVTGDRIPGRAIIIAALDNLTKGSSGQALQNANLMLGEEETTGLMLAPVFP